MGLAYATVYRWTVEEYKRLFEQGFIPQDARVELIEGEIVHMAAQLPPHTGAVIRSNREFVLAFQDSHYVSCQVTMDLSEYSAPEPDFCIIPEAKLVRGQPLEDADLIIEVANTSLLYDRNVKASLYAKGGIQEYWILNVRDQQLEVHRKPVAASTAVFGHAYASVVIVPVTGTASPLCRPDLAFAVERLL